MQVGYEAFVGGRLVGWVRPPVGNGWCPACRQRPGNWASRPRFSVRVIAAKADNGTPGQDSSGRERGNEPGGMDDDASFVGREREKLTRGRDSTRPGRDELERLDVDLNELDLDEIDDIVFDRGPLDEGKVMMFGGWLDERVAGRKASSSSSSIPAGQGPGGPKLDVDADYGDVTGAERDALVDGFFALGRELFSRGRYAESVTHLRKAVSFLGAGSRVGGQIELWMAQALDAAGDKNQAKKVFAKLTMHPDNDVRRVAEELLFIINAPTLALPDDAFIKIPVGGVLDPNQGSYIGSRDTSTAPLTSREPEKYSLEWYEQREPEPPGDAKTLERFLLVSAVAMFLLLCTFAIWPMP